MRKKLLFTCIALISLLTAHNAAAQYYSTGQTPARQKWRSLGDDSLTMVFPDEFESQARRVLFYMETARPHINYGLTHEPLKAPVVFKTENFYSNGLGMLAPKRIEMVAIPYSSSYSQPWLKELSTHEYRHMVQYGNINQSTVKVLSWFFGQQIPLVATGLLPFWFIEGDAVMIETQMSEYGRGLQPSFSMHYRAVGEEILKSKNPDKWFCGSYKAYVPSHYELGYQLVSYADRKYDTYIGDNMASYTSKYPFLIFTTQLALNKYHDTSTKQLFRETFTELNDLWASLPDVENSAQVIAPPVKAYTRYTHPLYLTDSTVLVLKQDSHVYNRFVEIDINTGEEKHIRHTGPVSSRPVMNGNTVLWTEYRQSMFWDQEVNSRLCSMNLSSEKTDIHKDAGKNVLYPTFGADEDMFYVKYRYDGCYYIEYVSEKYKVKKSYYFDNSISIHGLAWDDASEDVYFIGLSDEGMWIGGLGLDTEDLSVKPYEVKAPAYVTLGDLRAGDGMLYFNSIYSGKDEVHCIDLNQRREYRISNSRYGTFSASPSPQHDFVAVTTYDKEGYKAAIQEVEYWEEVEWTHIPRNIVNAPLKKWDVPVIDSVVFTAEDLKESESKYPSRKYRKGLHLFNVHSWAPLYFTPDELLADQSFDIQFGATAISQNILSSMESSLGYGYSLDGNSTVKAKFKYYGWAPKIEVTALWSDRGHAVYDPGNHVTPPGTSGYQYRGNTFQITTTVRLPILLSSGYRIRSITPTLQHSFSNMEFINKFNGESQRSSLMLGSVQYGMNVRRAKLDLQPRWGYIIRGSIVGDPFVNELSTAWSVLGRIYTPGILPHHGLTLSASYQEADRNDYMISVIDFQPRGHGAINPVQYAALSANYVFPIAYPDWGLSGVFFLKRIHMSLNFQYAYYVEQLDFMIGYIESKSKINTYGGTISFDITPFRMPDEATCTLTLGVYKPKGKSTFVTFGFSVPL